MGQIIAFPLTPVPYPDLTDDLDAAEYVLLIAIRGWVESDRQGDASIARLRQGLENAGAPEAALSIDGLMATVARAASRMVDIHPPRCPLLSWDEKHLLHAASLTQADEDRLAEKVLRTTLLSAQGAEFAMGPLKGLGDLFRQARLFLPRRRRPADDQALDDSRQAWSPPQSVH